MEGRVSVGPGAQGGAVDPHLTVHVHAVELDEDAFARIGWIERERLAVPAHAPVHESGSAATRGILVEPERGAPIMGYGQAGPR